MRDQAGELMLASVIPAQKLAAAVALTVRPGMAGKPSVIKGRDTRLSTAQGPGKGDDLKANPFRVREREFVFAVESKAIPLICHAVQARYAEPIPFDVTGGGRRLVLDFRLNDGRDLKLCCAGSLPVHDNKSRHLPVWPRRLARRSSCSASPEFRFIFNICVDELMHLRQPLSRISNCLRKKLALFGSQFEFLQIGRASCRERV